MFSFAVTELSNYFDVDLPHLIGRPSTNHIFLISLFLYFLRYFFSGVDLKHGFILIKIEI